MKNKKGIMSVLIVVGAFMFLVLIGVMMALGSSTINWVMDTAVPELTGLGMVGSWNATQTIDYTVAPVNTFIQNFTWLSGVVYVLGLLAIFGLAYGFRGTSDKMMIGFFFACVLILIIGCIFMSNIYQDVYDGNDVFASILHEHVMLSFLIIYSPGIFSILAFLAGIILFSGPAGGGI